MARSMKQNILFWLPRSFYLSTTPYLSLKQGKGIVYLKFILLYSLCLGIRRSHFVFMITWFIALSIDRIYRIGHPTEHFVVETTTFVLQNLNLTIESKGILYLL